MTPHEIDRLHLRLQQIGEVLERMAFGRLSSGEPTWRLIADIKQGLNATGEVEK